MSYFRIVGWTDLQHYKNRNPPWIKLHNEWLSSKMWVTLDDTSRVLAIACMLLASRTDNKIPNDPDYVRRVAYLNQDPDFSPLISCGFLSICGQSDGAVQADASNMQADASNSYISLDQRRGKQSKSKESESESIKTHAHNFSPKDDFVM